MHELQPFLSLESTPLLRRTSDSTVANDAVADAHHWCKCSACRHSPRSDSSHLQSSGQQYAILSQNNPVPSLAQYIQIAAPPSNEVVRSPGQQRAGTSAHVRRPRRNLEHGDWTASFQISITAAQLQQILNASQKNSSTKPVEQGNTDNEATSVDIKQQSV